MLFDKDEKRSTELLYAQDDRWKREKAVSVSGTPPSYLLPSVLLSLAVL